MFFCQAIRDSAVYQQDMEDMEVLSGSQLDIQEAASHSSNMFLRYTAQQVNKCIGVGVIF